MVLKFLWTGLYIIVAIPIFVAAFAGHIDLITITGAIVFTIGIFLLWKEPTTR